MKQDKEFARLKNTLFTLSEQLIKEGNQGGDIKKWFLGNALGTILLVCENNDDINKISILLHSYCEEKRSEMQELESLEKEMEKMDTREIPGMFDLLSDAGINLN